MAIMKATYTKQADGAKAAIRYIAHRPGRAGERMNRTLFNSDGALGRWQAYRMIDEADKGSYFYRLVVSPDPNKEDSRKDIFLREITETTMQSLAERMKHQISWVAAAHNDHAPHRHIHIVAVIPEKLTVQDLQALRHSATAACLAQRNERDLAQAHSQEQGEGLAWKR